MVIVEIDREVHWLPWRFESRAMQRFGWGPVAITVSRRDLYDADRRLKQLAGVEVAP